MSIPWITGFLFDADNEDKMAVHGVTPDRVGQILDNDHVIVSNRRSRRGSFLVVGRDNGGAFVTVPVEPTHDPSIWRPITAWPSKGHEQAWL